jgi:hypothetical protein
VTPDWSTITPQDPIYQFRGIQSIFEAAVEKLGATPADIPGLWNLPGHPELTSQQLLDLASRR